MSDDSRPSKTLRKQQMHDLQDLGAALVELNAADLESVELPERLREAVAEAKRLTKHEARRRQMQYIGKLMRTVDAAPIRERIAALQSVSRSEVARLHRIEEWRERLLASPDALAELMAQYPQAVEEHLRELVRGVEEDRVRGKPPRHYRVLFQALRDLLASA